MEFRLAVSFEPHDKLAPKVVNSPGSSEARQEKHDVTNDKVAAAEAAMADAAFHLIIRSFRLSRRRAEA